jgi:hypothetical protein
MPLFGTFAITTTMSAIAPFVAHSLVPLSRYPEPSSVGVGEQERRDVGARHQRQPALLLLLGAEQQQRLGDADRLMGGEQRRERGVHRAGQRQRAVVVDLREPEAAVPLGDLHPQRADLLEAVDDRLGDLRVALDRERVDGRGQHRPQLGEEPLALLDRGVVEPRLGVDEVEPQASEEQVLAEARQLPVALTGRFRDPPGFSFRDLRSHGLDLLPATD